MSNQDKNEDAKLKSPLALFSVQRRAELGFNQVDLAQASGISSGTIASIESGHSQAPKADTLEKLAKGLKVSYQELDCIIRGVSYKPSASENPDPLRVFEQYLLSHRRIPRAVAETVIEMVRTVILKYE